jgi:hypothetical protein
LPCREKETVASRQLSIRRDRQRGVFDFPGIADLGHRPFVVLVDAAPRDLLAKVAPIPIASGQTTCLRGFNLALTKHKYGTARIDGLKSRFIARSLAAGTSDREQSGGMP